MINFDDLSTGIIKVYLVKLSPNDELCLDRFSPSEKSQILFYKRKEDQMCKAVLFLLMNKLVKSQVGKTEFGKPYLINDSRINISLSHSYPYVLLALSLNPFGVDIEKNTVFSNEFIAKNFKKSELDSGLDLTLLWALKEAAYKVKGDYPFNPRKEELQIKDNSNLTYRNDDYSYASFPSIDGFSSVIVVRGRIKETTLTSLSLSDLMDIDD